MMSAVKNLPASTGDKSWIPGSGRAPGGGRGNALQKSPLENPVDGGGWWAVVHGVARSLTRLRDRACGGETLQHRGVRARGFPLSAPGPASVFPELVGSLISGRNLTVIVLNYLLGRRCPRTETPEAPSEAGCTGSSLRPGVRQALQVGGTQTAGRG